jgi:hypothetical protein
VQAGLSVAIEHFPLRHLEIIALAQASESFCSLCDDLMEASAALRQSETMASPHRERRVEEYGELVNSLLAEVVATLDMHLHHGVPAAAKP